MGLDRSVGYGGDSGSIHDLEIADLIIIVGSNTAEAHHFLATRVKRAHKLRGQKLIVFDLREHETARRADLFLRPRPSTDLVWLSASTRYIIESDLHHKEFGGQWVNDFDAYRKSLGPFTIRCREARKPAHSRNFRNGHPTPQLGVEVERKVGAAGLSPAWPGARSDRNQAKPD